MQLRKCAHKHAVIFRPAKTEMCRRHKGTGGIRCRRRALLFWQHLDWRRDPDTRRCCLIPWSQRTVMGCPHPQNSTNDPCENMGAAFCMLSSWITGRGPLLHLQCICSTYVSLARPGTSPDIHPWLLIHLQHHLESTLSNMPLWFHKGHRLLPLLPSSCPLPNTWRVKQSIRCELKMPSSLIGRSPCT